MLNLRKVGRVISSYCMDETVSHRMSTDISNWDAYLYRNLVGYQYACNTHGYISKSIPDIRVNFFYLLSIRYLSNTPGHTFKLLSNQDRGIHAYC